MKKNIRPIPLRERVYSNLLDRIVTGKLPPGAPIRDTRISEEMGVSRTPVREALLGLTREGLLENRHHRGFTVSPLSAEVVTETYPIINSLETLALKDTPTPGEWTLKQLKTLNMELRRRGNEPAARIRLDNEWHITLLKSCGNARLLELIREMKSVVLRYEYAYMTDAELVTHSCMEHHNIVEALVDADMKSALSMLNGHWQHTREVLLERLHAAQ